MRVFYRSVRRSLIVYEQTGATFCCEGMRRRWDSLIGFGARGADVSTSREVSLFFERSQTGKMDVLEMVSVNFCPFCGEEIETVRQKGTTHPTR